jgi:hypothetical protein
LAEIDENNLAHHSIPGLNSPPATATVEAATEQKQNHQNDD